MPAHSPPLPVVLVGCGAVARLFYLPALRELTRTGLLRTVAVVDPSPAARTAVGEALSAAAWATLAEVSAPEGALAIIASPPRRHAEQTLAACARGWHVLCEKPMAASSAECGRMIVAAAAANRILAVGHYKRFFPSSRYLKFLFGPDRPLGALREFSCAEGGPFIWPAAGPGFFQPRETPGGVLLDIGVHLFDLLLWWLGPPEQFSYADDAMGGLEANARVMLRFGSVVGHVQLSRDWPTTQRYEFAFERGFVTWQVNDANGLSVTLDGAPAGLQGRLHDGEQLAATNPQSFIAQLAHVATAARDGTPVLVDGQAGRDALELVQACYARRRLLAQPWLSAEETIAARHAAEQRP